MESIKSPDLSTGSVPEKNSLLPSFFEEAYQSCLGYAATLRPQAVLAAPFFVIAAAAVVTKGRVLIDAAGLAAKEAAPEIAPAAESLIGRTGTVLNSFSKRVPMAEAQAELSAVKDDLLSTDISLPRPIAERGGQEMEPLFRSSEDMSAYTDAGTMRSMLKAKGLVSESTDAELVDGTKVLHLEPQYGGADLSDSSRRVADVASRLGRPVTFQFSGVRSAVAPGNSGEAVEAAWRAAWDAEKSTPEAVEADRLLVERIAAQDARRAAANKQVVADLSGQSARGEVELIKALKTSGGNDFWMQHALKSLRHPEEMKTAVNYYAREAPGVAARNIEFAIKAEKWIASGTEDAWLEALAQLKTPPSS